MSDARNCPIADEHLEITNNEMLDANIVRITVCTGLVPCPLVFPAVCSVVVVNGRVAGVANLSSECTAQTPSLSAVARLVRAAQALLHPFAASLSLRSVRGAPRLRE